MKTIYADYNAMTERGHICLTCLGSQEAVRKAKFGVGDWAWLSDGEVIVGARLENDPKYGLVGAPDWDTIVHLDDETDQDPNQLAEEFQHLNTLNSRSFQDDARIFQILTRLETFIPPAGGEAVQPGYFAMRRAGVLRDMGKMELALVEFEDGRQASPADQDILFSYLEHLRQIDLDRAAREAEIEAEKPGAGAKILAACINVWSSLSEEVSDEQFQSMSRRILEWADRFEQADGRLGVSASVAALAHFNRGMVLLRLGQIAEAHRWLERAHQADPDNEHINEATRLETYNEHARVIASQLHSKNLTAAA